MRHDQADRIGAALKIPQHRNVPQVESALSRICVLLSFHASLSKVLHRSQAVRRNLSQIHIFSDTGIFSYQRVWRTSKRIRGTQAFLAPREANSKFQPPAQHFGRSSHVGFPPSRYGVPKVVATMEEHAAAESYHSLVSCRMPL